MTWTVWAAIVIVILTVAALIKRYETRLVLLASGFLMTCLSLDPMQGLNAFAKSMTNSGLIMAICSAMGFAFVVQMTKCDVHLVKLLSAPLSKLGLLLIPAATAITYFICIAIPSAAGCAAAVGPTMIPLLRQSRRQPSRNCRRYPRRDVRIHAFSRSFSQCLCSKDGESGCYPNNRRTHELHVGMRRHLDDRCDDYVHLTGRL